MLFRKMVRDIKSNISQFITIFLMVLIGVMAYAGIESYMDGMKYTADTFYSENNLEDLIAIGANFTKEDLDNIKSINHVKDAERKLSITALTDNDKTLLLNIIESNNISKFYIVDGEEFNVDFSGVWLDQFYADENNIKVGDTILVKYESMELHEEVKALVNVPDHLYDVRDESELYPDREAFGFAYLSVNEIDENYIKEKASKKLGVDLDTFNYLVPDFNYKENLIFNYVMIDVDKKSNKDLVKSLVDKKIDNAKVVMDVKDTPSYLQYQGEIDEGKTYVGVFSGLFLFIAMLSVITTMTRVVRKQRLQIGTLKAIGFKDRRVLLHYMGYGFYISLFGAVLGLILGYFIIGKIFIGLEMSFFEIPNGRPVLGVQNYIVALIVVLIAVLISYFTCRKILKEKPAETLRNEIPNVKSKSLDITTKGLFKNMNFSSKWNIRDIIRNKMRTIMGIAGVVGCCMLIVCALGMLDTMNRFVKLQFSDLYNFDYKLVLKEDITSNQLKELTDKYGNNTSSSLGIEIVNGKRSDSNNIFVTDANNLVRFIDSKDNFIKINSNSGVYVTKKLADTKGYKIGDTIKWHIYGDNKYYETKIVGFNKDPQNQNVTMTRSYLERLGITYTPDSLYTNSDLSNVKEIKNVESIQDIDALADGMSNMLSMMKTMLVLIISIAVILGVVIIYNLGILSYTEKNYQFATLKVLGFKDKQIEKIFVKQNNWIAIISVIIGCPLGYYLTDWLFKTAIEEHYDFGAYINFSTYIIGALGTFLVSYLVSKFLARKIKNIDMVSSLKANE